MGDARCWMLDAGCLMLDAGCWMLDWRLEVSYRELEVWKLARELAIDIHRMALEKLPKFEAWEEGSQIRRSIKSVRSTIVEGYGRRRYKQEFIRYLTFALASCDETADHLDMLFETGSLNDRLLYENLHDRLDLLGRKLNLFAQSVEKGHRSEK
jgi:four helix bundle protein